MQPPYEVFVNGVEQVKGTDFEAIGSTLLFHAHPGDGRASSGSGAGSRCSSGRRAPTASTTTSSVVYTYEGRRIVANLTPHEGERVTAAQAIQRARAGLDADALPRWATAVGLGLLCALSLWLRTRVLGAGFWIDEGISVGIAHHPLTAIPHLLREDGSPPLYYLLLHVWIGWFGDSERATHALSLIPALGCIPLAYWVARSLFGRTAGWICAALATVDPYLTYYGQETRMYTLAAFFSLVATGAFVRGVIEGRRRWLPVLVVSLDLLLYTHNWSLFFCVGLAVATVVFARERWRDALAAAAAVALLYAPWLPTLLYQVRHTGSPWAMRPGVHALVLAPGAVFAGDVAFGAARARCRGRACAASRRALRRWRCSSSPG